MSASRIAPLPAGTPSLVALRSLVALCSLLALSPAPALSQAEPDGGTVGSPPAPLADFDAYVREAVGAWEVPGLAVAVVKDGEAVFSRGYGVRGLGREGPADSVDAATLFAIGSTTKAMTAAAIGMLADEGAVALDDPVVEHLPWFRLADPALTAQVTVRDLLTHRAGLGNADFLWYGQDASTEEIVRRLRHLEPAYPPRSDFIYQNIMYAAAGEVVEAVSDRPWEAFLRERILEPLGMGRTATLLAEARERENVASPHDEVHGELTVIENASVDPVRAAGSVWSSVGDMSRWIAFLLGDCRTASGERLLEEETCAELFRPQAVIDDGFYPTARLTEPGWTTYGLGWFQHDYEGRKVDFHTGSIDGVVAIAGMIREEGLGVYVLANRDHAEVRHALMYRVFDLYDPEPPRDWSRELRALYDELTEEAETRRASRNPARVEGTSPSLDAERYVGVYGDPLYGTVRILPAAGGAGEEAGDRGGDRADPAGEAGGARVPLHLRYGRRTGRLEHWHYDTFRVVWDAAWRGDALVTFTLGADGEVETLEMGGMELSRTDEEE